MNMVTAIAVAAYRITAFSFRRVASLVNCLPRSLVPVSVLKVQPKAPLERPRVLDVKCVMPSTVISRFVYDETEHELWVEFVTGRRYVYSGVPHEVAETFRTAFAKGVYFNTRIRDRYPHREVTHEDEGQETQS
jgi:hypothetical protein